MQLTDPELADLAVLAAWGDEEAFLRLRSVCSGSVAAYLRSKVADPVVVEALLAETFRVAWTTIGSYEPTALPVQDWLLRVTQSAVTSRYAQGGR